LLPDPMAGLVKITAPQKLLCCEREQMLHPHKAGLSRI